MWFSGESVKQKRGSVMVYLPAASNLMAANGRASAEPERSISVSHSVKTVEGQRCCETFRGLTPNKKGRPLIGLPWFHKDNLRLWQVITKRSPDHVVYSLGAYGWI